MQLMGISTADAAVAVNIYTYGGCKRRGAVMRARPRPREDMDLDVCDDCNYIIYL